MHNYKQPDLAERQNRSADARQKLLERFRLKSAANDPAAAERLAARQAVQAASARRQEARKAEAAQAAAAAEADSLVVAAAAEAAIVNETELAASQKAARDARYAARKARRA